MNSYSLLQNETTSETEKKNQKTLHRRLFRCLFCNKGLMTDLHREWHYENVHVEIIKTYHCQFSGCCRIFYNDRDLFKHIGTHKKSHMKISSLTKSKSKQ